MYCPPWWSWGDDVDVMILEADHERGLAGVVGILEGYAVDVTIHRP